MRPDNFVHIATAQLRLVSHMQGSRLDETLSGRVLVHVADLRLHACLDRIFFVLWKSAEAER